MKILVTGATGYIGTRLTFFALKRGHDVVSASRQRPAFFAIPWVFFDLSFDDSIVLPTGIDAVIHLAANTTHTDSLCENSEVSAARKLIKSAQEADARFIFVSSQTARADAPTAYGRTKWRIEQEVLSAGGWVVRPGQVYGGELRGLFGALARTIKELPLLPAFMPAPDIQPIHIDDLTEGLLRIAEPKGARPGVYFLAAPEPVPFSKFLAEIAKSRLRCQRSFVPAPVRLVDMLAPLLGKTSQTRLKLERLHSLFDLPVMDTAPDLKQLGLTLRPLHSGMHPSGSDRRRKLLKEGRALLVYVLKDFPGNAVLRRYVRTIESLRDGQALDLPQTFLSRPILLSLLDHSAWTDQRTWAEFSWRIDTATVLAEATPSGAYRYLQLDRKYGRLNSLLSIGSAMVCELLWRILRPFFLFLTRHALARARGSM
ncbi:MAG: hypothetical protein A3F73_03715 [Gallionellales bacterium RIFCSPLOWO2_12_FULL_59_22]|nr:MAG: hypothetical protein A3H99_01035 [Gallionellales bacterium RIFCSPLOWO2_02_FULL_59_110]OGT01428.1 MAG: hypothetical protein A2Z65_13755 [Gallionellales bacterium RIFCSPLOWO2_02_58_13]OGT14493.1 MAG: hypothetical protein A3F73_03715 [Gallionellales bacterium RIFCSPLOWO2_12_FULL_59_22]